MPSQSRSDGESIPDHLIRIESPDLAKVLAVRLMETGEEDARRGGERTKKRQKGKIGNIWGGFRGNFGNFQSFKP